MPPDRSVPFGFGPAQFGYAFEVVTLAINVLLNLTKALLAARNFSAYGEGLLFNSVPFWLIPRGETKNESYDARAGWFRPTRYEYMCFFLRDA